jgi:hypothetical protein
MFYSQDVKADSSVYAPHSHASTVSLSVVNNGDSEELTLKPAEQQFSEDASASAIVINLQQAATYYTRVAFAFPFDEAIPPYAARAPGVSFLTKFFPISIQPHAP